MPQNVICALIPTAHAHGSFTSSCFAFKDHGVKNVKLSIGGQSYPSYQGIQVNFSTQPGMVETYLSIAHDFLLSDHGLFQSFSDLSTHVWWSFDLGGYFNFNNDHMTKLRTGSGRISISFKESVKNENLTLLVFSLTDQVISISADRTVSKGYVS